LAKKPFAVIFFCVRYLFAVVFVALFFADRHCRTRGRRNKSHWNKTCMSYLSAMRGQVESFAAWFFSCTPK
jgi:hypothetical protein